MPATLGTNAAIDWRATRDHAEAKLDGGKIAEVVLKKNQGMSDEPINHEEVMETGAKVAEIFKELLRRIISKIN